MSRGWLGHASGVRWGVSGMFSICLWGVLWMSWTRYGCGMLSVECVFGKVLVIFGNGRWRKEKMSYNIDYVANLPEFSALVEAEFGGENKHFV